MSIQDTLGTLANNLRSASGYQNKLSLADMSSMATGLTTYNLLPNTSTSYKEVSVGDGQWSHILYQGLSLPAGTYTYSIYADLTGYNGYTSNRIEWSKIGVGNTGIGDNSSIASFDWGTLSNIYIQPNKQGLVAVTFKLAVADTINVGLSGGPYTKGTFKYARPMLNVGTFPLPYTSNTLVKEGGRK
jgi:hypothetical protein